MEPPAQFAKLSAMKARRPMHSHGSARPAQFRVVAELWPALMLAGLLSVSVVRAEYRYVSLSGSHEAPFTNWVTAATSLQAAVDASISGDFIWVTDGVYRAGATITPGGMLSNRVVITNDITLQSVNGRDVTIIEGTGPLGSNAVRCVYMAAGTLRGFTLTNGFTQTAGTQTLDRCGGGVFAVSGRVEECLISGNAAGYSGGGAQGGTLLRCELCGNTAIYGGGAYTGTLKSCAIWDNYASGSGGGLNAAVAVHCTITDNTAPGAVGGAHGGALTNCVVYYNHGGGTHPEVTAKITRCCVATPRYQQAQSLIHDPQLLSHTQLAPGSICIGKGMAAAGGAFDLDGDPWAEPPSLGCDEPGAGPVGGPLAVSIRAETTQAVSGAAVQLVGVTRGRLASNRWDLGDGTILTNAAFPSYAWPTAGTYDVVFSSFNATHPDGVAATARIAVLSAEDTAVRVSTNSPYPGPPYNAWTNAAHTIQEAADAQTLFGGWVLVTNGTYENSVAVTPGGGLSNRLVITNNIHVRSVNGPAVTSIRGLSDGAEGNRVRCVFISAGRLEGFTLTNGGTWSGGNYDLDACGAGVNAMGGLVVDCTIANNVAGGDGGGANRGTFHNCRFIGNRAFAFSGAADWSTLVKCLVLSNAVTSSIYQGFGGGLGGGTAINCELRANSAKFGGGAYLAALINCTVAESRYHTGTPGEGVRECEILSCTVVSNAVGALNSQAADSIIARNSSDLSGTACAFCCTRTDPGGPGNTTNVPLFIDATSGNYRLQYFSPCVNAGTNGLWTAGATDLDGNPRIVGGTVDIGAYESPADSDSDGLSDPWEQHYAGGLTNLTFAGDWDGDGCSDGDEMKAGTNPMQGSSFLRVVAIESNTNGDAIIVRWASELGRVYSLCGATNTVEGMIDVLHTNIVATPPMNSVTGAMPAEVLRIYGVELQSPP